MRALIATDGSEFSITAARRAQQLLSSDLTLALVAVVPPRMDPNQDATGFAAPVISDVEAEDQHTGQVVEGHGSLAATARALGPDPIEQYLVEGSPGHAICDLAEELGVSVVVVGSHGKGFLAKTVLGSVSSHVVRHAPCPVLVVRPGDAF
jgi:nucleotide-binding universal stress UspA family protein